MNCQKSCKKWFYLFIFPASQPEIYKNIFWRTDPLGAPDLCISNGQMQ